MRKYTTMAFILLFCAVQAQDDMRGSLGFGAFKACPQNGLQDSGYDDGWGFKMTYLSRNIPVTKLWNLQLGARMDFSAMDHRDFDPVVLNTPTEDMGDLKVKNSMFGMFAVGRLSYNMNKFQPFVEGLVGFRDFSTSQLITAQNPSLNPEYEATSYFDNVVSTSRFHYGGSIGIAYYLSKHVILESSVTYTEGGVGAIMPLSDIYQQGQVLRYPHTFSETDMLLINAGIRFQFYKVKRSTSTRTRSTAPSTTPRRDPVERDSSPPPPPPPPKKKLEVKPPSVPKKKDGVKS